MEKYIKYIIRIIFIIILLFPLLYYKEFYDHFYAHFTGNFINRIIINNWKIVILNILVFVAFLIPLSYRKKADWKEYGIVSAFFISLFVEMYGIPFTMLFASKYFSHTNINIPNAINFEFLGVGFGMTLAMVYGAIVMAIGIALIIIGWITLYLNVKNNNFVRNGIYKYSRHPQYLGFVMLIYGWLIGWPTILTVIFAPILIYKYIKVAITEEKEITKNDPEYNNYKETVPLFI